MTKQLTQEQQKTLNNLFHDAAHFGKLFFVKFFINLGADIHVNNDLALWAASSYGHFDVVKYLVEHGANILIDNDAIIRDAATKEIKEYLENKSKIEK